MGNGSVLSQEHSRKNKKERKQTNKNICYCEHSNLREIRSLWKVGHWIHCLYTLSPPLDVSFCHVIHSRRYVSSVWNQSYREGWWGRDITIPMSCKWFFIQTLFFFVCVWCRLIFFFKKTGKKVDCWRSEEGSKHAQDSKVCHKKKTVQIMFKFSR